MPKLITHDDYIQKVSILRPDIEVIGTYSGARTSIPHRCKIHNYIWDIRPDNILHGRKCPECHKDATREIRHFSHDEFCEKLKSINPHIIPLEEYSNMKTPILFKCNTHNIKWATRPENVLNNCGCEKCFEDKYHRKINTPPSMPRKSHNDFVTELLSINNNLEVIGEYVNAQTKIKVRCKIDGHIWDAIPYNLLKGSGCPKCANNIQLTQDVYEDRLKNINPNIIVLDKYINNSTHLKHRCLLCGYEWSPVPATILLGYGCPNCVSSSGETFIINWLNKNNINYIFQKRFDDCRDINPLPFDFYLPDLNKCIEYDGKQHYEPIKTWGGQEELEYIRKHDEIKNKYCKENNITLLRIPYYADIEIELENFLLAS